MSIDALTTVSEEWMPAQIMVAQLSRRLEEVLRSSRQSGNFFAKLKLI